jgi:FMN phosphatase YigB (HAD superfamily)
VDAPVEVVFLDVGGVIYDDACFAIALLAALRELGGEVDDDYYWRAYDELRQAQDGLGRRLAARFLPPGADPAALRARTAARWHHPPESLYPDALPCLERLRRAGYRIGIIANQEPSVLDALKRDGLDRLVDVWAVSGVLGVEKPDPRIFQMALAMAGVPATRAAHIGNRLDTDVRPAKAAGLRAVWVLRGEAPPCPAPEQLAEADGWVRSLAELPSLLERLETT